MRRAVVLDLGSTRLKAAAVKEDGSLADVRAVAAPPLTGRGLIREGDPMTYLRKGTELLKASLSGLPEEVPVGLAAQRSTFLLWDRKTGAPATPLISWQDRRADSWCSTRRDEGREPVQRTGLLLSPHYAGPKLAYLFSTDRSLKTRAASGSLHFGTLETWFLWNRTGRTAHETDLSMAARTLLADPETGTWSGELLRLFGVPACLLPAITSTWGRDVPLESGGLVTATVTDQAAGLAAVMGRSSDILLISLGTGGFVICPTGTAMRRVPGYLSGPLFRGPNGEKQFAIEGTVNGIGGALEGLHDENVALFDSDPLPHGFCLPDTSGIGSPYWLADMPPLFSSPEKSLAAADKKRIIMEGIIFRIVRIAEDLCGQGWPSHIYLSGGLCGEEFICRGLASALEQPIHILKQREATLLGAARLALSLASSGVPVISRTFSPGLEGCYLREKFSRWEAWVGKEIQRRRNRP